MRVNYDSQNGHPYYAVGKWLIDKKIYTKEEMSMDRIRQWMTANPEEGKELRRLNKSYVFFRETGLAADIEPVGAQGVSLTAGRSIAVDRNLHVYGTPFFIQAELPIDGEQPTTKWRRLMFAQDTGGAIVGPARADIYYGAGEPAGLISGRFKQPGQFTMLFPKSIDPFAAEREDEEIPLPKPRPANIPQDEVTAAKPEVVAAATTARAASSGKARREEAGGPQNGECEAGRSETRRDEAGRGQGRHQARSGKAGGQEEARAEERIQEDRQAHRARAAGLVRYEQTTARSRRTFPLEIRHPFDRSARQAAARRPGRHRAAGRAGAQGSSETQGQGCRRCPDRRRSAGGASRARAARPQGEAPSVARQRRDPRTARSARHDAGAGA